MQTDLTRKGRTISAEYRINREIRAREVRLVTDEGNQGVMPLERALDIAAAAGLDLVEVAPEARPPVVRAMDFGKFQYEQQRKERKARKNQVKIEVKQIQLTPKTDDHHLGFKVDDARKWLQEGKKVKFKVRFRGREITHSHLGREQLERIQKELSDVAVVEQAPNLEGRDMTMVLSPAAEKK